MDIWFVKSKDEHKMIDQTLFHYLFPWHTLFEFTINEGTSIRSIAQALGIGINTLECPETERKTSCTSKQASDRSAE